MLFGDNYQIGMPKPWPIIIKILYLLVSHYSHMRIILSIKVPKRQKLFRDQDVQRLKKNVQGKTTKGERPKETWLKENNQRRITEGVTKGEIPKGRGKYFFS